MKLLLNILSIFGLSFASPAIILAHETGETHTEPPASVDPVIAVMVVVAVMVLAFLVWKFVLNKKDASPSKPS